MAQLGFHASHELYAPSRLLALVQQAEDAGFRAGMCSDHFHPWTEDQGNSGFAWSWLGAALQATSLSFGTVCAPGQRYHPAIIAQAAATLAEMYPERFWLAVGTGEALNESITGDAWPDKAARRARLMECVFIMRALWAGEEVSHTGSVRVHRAKLHTLPAKPPLIVGAAITEDTAEWVGGWADALVTVGSEPEDLRNVVHAFREGGGENKPMFLQAALSYAPTKAEATRGAWEHWPVSALDPDKLDALETPHDFTAALQGHAMHEIEDKMRISADLQHHIDWLYADFELGFDAVYLHHVGPDIERFLQVFGEKVVPHFR